MPYLRFTLHIPGARVENEFSRLATKSSQPFRHKAITSAAWGPLGRGLIKAQPQSGEHWWDAEISRVRGLVALSRGQLGGSKWLLKSLQIARQQRAKSLELRAATSLARLWRDEGKRTAARDLLAPVYGWFTEGFDTLDLKEAKALLDDLAS